MPPESKLPEFKNPPVAEVVLGVQFGSLPTMKNQHVFTFWAERLKKDFPKISEHPIVAPVFETFSDSPMLATPSFQTFFSPPMPRYWFEAENGTELLQLQQDQIIHNWRQVKGDEPYPRFNPIRDRFLAEYSSFVDFIGSNKLGSVQPNQCTVTYINTIKLADGGKDMFSRLHEITPLWDGSAAQRVPARLEDATIQLRAILEGEKGPFARLYIVCAPSVNTERQEKAFRMEITARGHPNSVATDQVFRLLQTLHDCIVTTFAEVTTENMQKVWGRSR